MTDTDNPWRNPDHYSYKGESTHSCLACGKGVPYSSWGPWCHPCNVTRMERINTKMVQLEERIKAEGDK